MAENQPSTSSTFQTGCCVICKEDFQWEIPVTVTDKGIKTLIRFSDEHGCLELKAYLTECMKKIPNQKVLVHQKCRRDFTDHKRVPVSCSPDALHLPPTKKLISSEPSFDWKTNCMICGNPAKFDVRHPDRNRVQHVTTLPIRDKLLECCSERGDTWAYEVQNRLCGCIDLVAAEAIYHANCFSRFFSTMASEQRMVGRPQDKSMLHCFKILCQWLESIPNAEPYTLAELHAKMIELSDCSEVYSPKWLKQKLFERYGDSIFFTESDGRDNVLCFKSMADCIINDKWYAERKTGTEEEAQRIVVTAAKIIRAEIRGRRYDSKFYPSNEDISDIEKGKQWIPGHLQTFLKAIIESEQKQTSIGHAILQASRPRSVITPTLFGVGVELDHVFGSRWLVDQLSRLGFSISYDEVNRYRQSVIYEESFDNILSEYLPGTFTQWVADNVDHNVATLDGSGSLHGMGIIAISTAEGKLPLVTKSRVIKRQQRTSVHELLKDKAVTILQYVYTGERALASTVYKPVVELQVPQTLPLELCSNLLWHNAWTCSSNARPRPSWSGFMQNAFSDQSIAKSEVLLLPIIDLNPSDESCIYSTLIYIQRQASALNITTPCITFDQPLWLKAVEIIKAKSLNIVCRLGGFHTMMSFLSSIGSMMKGSGLEEALETIYGPNAVVQIISGKAISRALRAHFLVEAALVNKLILAISPEPAIGQNECDDNARTVDSSLDFDDIERIHDLYSGIEDKSVHVCDVADSKELLKLNECLNEYKELYYLLRNLALLSYGCSILTM